MSGDLIVRCVIFGLTAMVETWTRAGKQKIWNQKIQN